MLILDLSVYEKEQLFPVITDENGNEIPSEVPAEEASPLFSSNSGGTSMGETLIFQTESNKEYYLKVSNKSLLSDFNIFDMMMGGFFGPENREPAQSALPYSVHLEGKSIPADEDNYSGSSNSSDEKVNVTQTNTGTIITSEMGAESWDDAQKISELESVARPISIGRFSNRISSK